MARLDRLGPAREVAQVGAVIGRGFSYGLLRAVAGMDDAPLQAALEKLADADIVLVQGLPPDSDYRFKHALIQDAAYENLLKSRRQALHRRVAETLRDRFADTAAAEPEALAHHFTQAGLTDAAIAWWGKAGDQALRRSAFQEAISHLGKAIEMADKEGDAKPRAAAPASAGPRLKLQTTYGNALIAARGHGASETVAAFARARELEGIAEPVEQLSVFYGQWVGSFIRCEISLAREVSAAALKIAERYPETAVAAIAYRLHGLICWFEGDFATAWQFLERSLALFDPDRDRDLAFRFGQDIGVAFMNYLAFAIWPLGQTARAQQLQLDAVARARQTEHVPTLAYEACYRAVFEMMRLDPAAAAPFARETVQLAKAHELQMYKGYGGALNGWARAAHLGELMEGMAEMRQGIEDLRQIGINLLTPLFHARLASLEAKSGKCEGALARLNQALADSAQRENRTFDAELHRVRGEILLKSDPANTAPAEEAFLPAIAVAQQQKAKSIELRAALSLAKLYQSTGRAADAHAVLAPALAGFAPTPEFPEIAEAQALLAALAQSDEVKNAAASRQRRLQLQNKLGQALIWSKGYGAEETKAAFKRAKELAAGTSDTAERFATYYGLWVGSLLRAELKFAQQTAENFLQKAKAERRLLEAAVVSRNLGVTRLYQGAPAEARAHLEEALRNYDSDRDSDAKIHFAQDHRAASKAFLAQALWVLGEVGYAGALTEEAVARAVEAAHPPTLANTLSLKAQLEILRGDAQAVQRSSQRIATLAQEHGLALMLANAMLYAAWARAALGDLEAGRTELRQAIAAYINQGNRLYVPWFQGLLAELGTEADSSGEALRGVDEALALADETGEHWTDAFLHRIRGDILLKRDPANTAPAEDALLTAIAIAQQQKARSFELRAALSLAKLYQSTDRAGDAHAVLAPALTGFSPTPEFPEIAQARALLATLPA